MPITQIFNAVVAILMVSSAYTKDFARDDGASVGGVTSVRAVCSADGMVCDVIYASQGKQKTIDKNSPRPTIVNLNKQTHWVRTNCGSYCNANSFVNIAGKVQRISNVLTVDELRNCVASTSLKGIEFTKLFSQAKSKRIPAHAKEFAFMPAASLGSVLSEAKFLTNGDFEFNFINVREQTKSAIINAPCTGM